MNLALLGYFKYRTEQLMGMLRAELDFTSVDAVIRTGLHEYLEQIQERLVEISNAMQASYCANSTLENFATD